MKEISLCKLCLEPISNFICVECLKKEIYHWLEFSKSNLAEDFKEIHITITKHFPADEIKINCLKCKEVVSTLVCPWCYVNEVFSWLFRKNVYLAYKFVQIFNFDFLGTGYISPTDTPARKFHAVIISERSNVEDTSICDGCGQVADSLREENGFFLCESCRDL